MTNASRGTTLADRAECAQGPVGRFLGLMGRRGWGTADGLLLESCNSIHTFFMRMPIDAVFLDREDRVLRAGVARPWRIGPLAWRARRVLELPVGTVTRSETRVGDRLVLTD